MKHVYAGLSGILVALAVAMFIMAGMARAKDSTPPAAPCPVVTVQEDDPGWDCATMGNRTCGPTGAAQ